MKIALLGAAALIGVVAVGAPARASVIVTLLTDTAVSGGADYTYQVTLSQDEQLNNSVQASFFDIYNFGIAKLVSETGDMGTGAWGFSNPYLNSSQYAEGVDPKANASLAVLRFVYTGPILTGPSLGAASGNLGTFTVFTTSTGGYTTESNAQDAQLAKYAPGETTNNTPASNIDAASVPIAPTVPEPASLLLLVSGMAGMCAFGYRRGPRSLQSKIS